MVKCVILIDQSLPLGLIANTASVLSLSLGNKISGLIGHDIEDIQGRIHIGITTIPIPILKCSKTELKNLRETLFDERFKTCLVVDFTNAAQSTKTYDDYSKAMGKMAIDALEYLGIAIYGSKKLINKLTGSIGLLR